MVIYTFWIQIKKYLSNFVFIAALLCIFVFYSGIINIPENYTIKSLIPYNSINEISGKLVSSPAKTSTGKTYSAYINLLNVKNNDGKSSATGKIKVYIPVKEVEAYYPGKLYSSVNNKQHCLYESGGYYTFRGFFNENSFIVNETIDGTFYQNLSGKISLFRAKCRLQFKRLMYSWGKAGGLFLALICGAREYTEESISEYFKKAGLSHILALSGMHLSMFSGIAMFFGNKVGRKKIAFLIRIISLILFVWFAGFSPSLLRAFICSMLLIISTIVNSSKIDLIIILCLSFLIQCVIAPLDIFNTGFILSYSALAGILLLNKLISSFYSSFIPKRITYSLAASTSAQMITAPVSLKIFGSFSPIGVISTVFVSPVVTIFIYSGLFLLLLSLVFPVFSTASGIFMNFLYTIIKNMVKVFSLVPVWSIN